MIRNRKLSHTYVIPLIIFLGLILDGIIMNVFSSQLIDGNYVLVPRLMMVLLIVLSLLFPKQPLFFYAFIFGVIYDSYYVGVVGIYTAGIVSCIYLLKRSQQYVQLTPLVLLLLYFLSLSYIEIFSFTTYTILSLVDMSFFRFLITRLAPTLLLNTFFLVFTYLPLRKLSDWMYR
ncbi:rod shape-determining protein MreD [Jeotgalibaca dankookensis]|uniref:rod shape-determining protein MreD n=1 Tax=Jeotgalibaca dankookensis TaxID=708126 RepID=UPI00078117DB|nr:rod shape-determining protein MreD [Jeotgalibaca dankookensis]